MAKGKATPASWKKGQSGNPGGKPKVAAEVKALAREYGAEAIDKLVALMRGAEDEKTQLNAAESLLDRGYGRPTQAISGDDGGPVRVDVAGEALVALFERLAVGGS